MPAPNARTMRKSWKMWLIVLLSLFGLSVGLGIVLMLQGSWTAGVVVARVGGILANAWIIYGLIAWRHVPWVRRFGLILIATAAVQMLILICWAFGWTDMVIALAGVYAMAMIFYAGLWLIRLLLSPSIGIFGVARTLIDEAIRMKIALVFIIGVALLIAIFPFAIDQEDFLKYRITSFLTWSMMATSLLLSLMTIFLAIATITREQKQKQIYITLTKPLHRGEYLLGKWLGITLLNLLLLSVACAGIYAFTKLLEAQPARDDADRLAVQSQVLVARKAIDPTPPEPAALQSMYNDMLERLRDEDPERYGNPGDPQDVVLPVDRADIQQKVMLRWFTIPNRSRMVYRFTGLNDAKNYSQPIQLRFKPKLAGQSFEGYCFLGLRINGRPFSQPGITTEAGLLKLAENNFHVLDINPAVIDENGTMDVEISNPAIGNMQQPALSFNPKDGLEVLYRVGDFEANLIRSFGIIWLRLMFLAMLGLAAGSYLGFPVASLVCLLIYCTAAGNAYIAESLKYYAAFPNDALPLWAKIMWLLDKAMSLISEGEYYDLFKMIIKLIGSGFLLVAPSFGDLNATPLVSDGRVVPTEMLIRAVTWAGLVWTGLAGFIGWIIFRGKELARVTV